MTIHCIAPENKDKWHPTWKKCFDTWCKTKHDINVWTYEGIDELLKKDDNEFYEKYLSKLDNIYKWDYVRYVILERYGGAYFDMDIEIVDASFLDKLNWGKFYFMESSSGGFIENSIMIASKIEKERIMLFSRLKDKVKHNVITNFQKCKDNKVNTLEYVGAFGLSNFISNLLYNVPIIKNVLEILGYHQFASLTNEIVFTRHWQTSVWK